MARARRGRSRISPRALYAWSIAITVVLLLPLLIFPFSNDQALYFLSGRKILEGAVHYRDILDLKPPLIYHIYALAVGLFGPSVIAVRIFDVIVQGATAWMLMSLVRRASGDTAWAAATGIIYSLLYISQGYGCTGTAESFSGIFAAGMLWLLLHRRTRWGFVGAGALAGMLFLLKFTLGIVLAGAMLAEWIAFDRRGRELVASWIAMIAGFALTASLLALYLIGFGAVADFLRMNRFIASYSRIQWKSVSGGIKNMLQLVPQRFTDNYSMLLFLATVVGVASSIRGRAEHVDGGSDERSTEGFAERAGLTVPLLRLLAIELFLLLATVTLEGKYSAFQFSRLYPFAVPLAAYGLLLAARRLLRARPLDAYGMLAAGAIAIGLLVFSPLNRYVWHSGAAVTAIVKGAAGLDAYYNQQQRGYSMEEIARVGRFIDSTRLPGERAFIASREAPMVYLAAREVPEYRVLHSAFIVAPFAPEEWRDSTDAYLLRRRPAFIVVQRGDTMPDVTDSYGTSAGTIHALPGVDHMLGSDYDLSLRTAAYDVYRKRRSTLPNR